MASDRQASTPDTTGDDGRDLPAPVPDRPESDPDDEIGLADDLAAFRNSIDLTSGRIDRLLCELRNEIPFGKFRDLLRTLIFIVRNIVKQPDEMKFRLLKASNPKLLEQLFQYDKCIETLSALGFTKREDCYQMGPPDIPLLERALLLLQRLQNRSQRPVSTLQQTFADAAAAANRSADVAEVSLAVERNVTIFDESLGVPQNPQLVADSDSSDVADGDMEILSAAARDLRRRAKFAQLLVPQSYVQQQLQATSTHVKPSLAKIRVRIQRRILVQAQFAVHEALRDVADVVRSVLKDPQRHFRFVLPPATILDESALNETLLDLKLTPSAVMYAEFSDNIELSELLTPDALQSARRLEFNDPKGAAADNAAAGAAPDKPQQPIRVSRGGGGGSGRVPAWFKK